MTDKFDTSSFDLKSIPSRKKRTRRSQRPIYKAGCGNSCLYAVGCEGHDFVKFGRSNAPYSRMYQHQIGSPAELFMFAFIEAEYEKVVQMETALIAALRKGEYPGRGEWFCISQKSISPMFRLLAEQAGAEIVKEVGMTDLPDADALDDPFAKVSAMMHSPTGRVWRHQ